MNYYLAKTANNDLPVALLTTFKIIETENLTEEIGNVGALKVILLTPDGKPMNVFVVHLDPFSSETRLCEVNTLVQQMQPYIGQTTILMGDMNCYLGQQESKRLNKTGWKRVASGVTS